MVAQYNITITNMVTRHIISASTPKLSRCDAAICHLLLSHAQHILKDVTVLLSSNGYIRVSDGTYLFGYFRKMSLMTTMASCTT